MSYRPSNGTEGRWFQEQTCKICVHDHGWHDREVGPFKWEAREPADGQSCPIMMRALAGERVTEWSIEDGVAKCRGYAPDLLCIEIREAYSCGLRAHQQTTGTWTSPYPVEPERILIHPDQLEMF